MMLTANSMTSRNTALGFALGEGRPLAKDAPLSEGRLSAAAVAALARGLDVQMPITFALERVLERGEPLEAVLAQFLRAPAGS
jgi:glycerol-3-phosphate dehydrogenase (NAD(P)+)